LKTACFLIFAVATAAEGQTAAARQAELAGDFATAEKAYEQELRTHPSPEIWQRLGLTRHLQSRFESAIPAFREALRLSPSLWTSRLMLGMCLYRVNHFEEAQAALERARRDAPPADPGRDEIDYWLGAALIAGKRPLSGLATIEELLSRGSARLDALQLAVHTYADLGSSLWNGVAERSFDSAPGWEVHGHALEAEGNVMRALEAYRRARELAPGRTGPATAIGRLLLREGKAAEAREVLESERKLAPGDPAACYYAGLAEIQLGNMAAAAPLLETADRWTTHDPEPAIALAQVYLALSKPAEAAAAARRALTLAPTSRAAAELLKVIRPAK
jgi:tetratricopeptide (TPR) repeat protein